MTEAQKLKLIALLIYLCLGVDVMLGLAQCATIAFHYFIRHTPTPDWVWLSALAHPLLLWGIYQLMILLKRIHATRSETPS